MVLSRRETFKSTTHRLKTYASRPRVACLWVRAASLQLLEGNSRLEMLALQMKEVEDELDTLGAAGKGAGGKVLKLGTGVLSTLQGMHILLEHIGDVLEAQASSSGATPLMSP